MRGEIEEADAHTQQRCMRAEEPRAQTMIKHKIALIRYTCLSALEGV